MAMDAGTRRRLTLGLISNLISRGASSIIQVVQVPVLLTHWAEPVVGNWFLLNSVPNYLSFSTQGFGNVAGAEMMMAESRGDREGALRSFQSCWWLIVLALCVLGSLVGIAAAFFPLGTMLNVHDISASDTAWIVVYLGLSVLFSQVEQLLQCAYRCVGRYSYGVFVKAMLTLGAFAATLVPVFLHYGPRTAALVYALANAGGTVVLAVMVRHDIPWIRFGWKHATVAEIRRMTSPAFAFMAFPMGQALNLQGTLMAVGYALGPIAVVVFQSARTVSRVALQMVQMINASFEPEFAKSFAQRDDAMIRTLNRRACQMALILAMSIVLLFLLGGPFFLNHWTHGKVPPSRPLLSILLLVVILFSLWSTSSTMLTATNQHKRLAAVFMTATSVTVVITWMLARWFSRYGENAGLLAAASSLLLAETLMNFYVVPATLRIAHDTFPAFLRAMFDVPPALHPQALLRRLRRSRPALEV